METRQEIAAALDGARTRWDHGDAPYNPDMLPLIRAAETMWSMLFGSESTDSADPMPVFVVKAKDRMALDAVYGYLTACRAHGLDVQVEQVRLAYEEMRRWQGRNPGLMKLPDHPHVPTT